MSRPTKPVNGLARLKECKSLAWLNVAKTNATPKGVAEFAKAHPQCQIEHDGVTEPKK